MSKFRISEFFPTPNERFKGVMHDSASIHKFERKMAYIFKQAVDSVGEFDPLQGMESMKQIIRGLTQDLTAEEREQRVEEFEREAYKNIERDLPDLWDRHVGKVKDKIRDLIVVTNWLEIEKLFDSYEMLQQANAHFTAAKTEVLFSILGAGAGKVFSNGKKIVSTQSFSVNCFEKGGSRISSKPVMTDTMRFERSRSKIAAGVTTHSTNLRTGKMEATDIYFIEVGLGEAGIKGLEEMKRPDIEAALNGNNYQGLDPFDFQFESQVAQYVNKAADITTDFIPVVGNVKSAGKVIGNVILGYAKTKMADRLLLEFETPVNEARDRMAGQLLSYILGDYACIQKYEFEPLLDMGGVRIKVKDELFSRDFLDKLERLRKGY